MDRRALASLRASRGYPQFLVAATVARLADEMFAVGVVLLVLERTGSPALAGLTIAAATLPAIASGPVIGAWLDRTGKRSLLYKVDRLLLVACLLGILAAAGNAPDFVVPLLGFITGITLPATFGGLTSFIPLLVEPHLLGSANALEASSFNAALILGPAIAGTTVALGGPSAAILVEVALTLVALVLLLRIPDLDRGGSGATEPFVQSVKDGIGFAVREPIIRAITVPDMFGMLGSGALVVAFPLWAHADLGVSSSAAGYLWAAFAFGSLFGALAFADRQRRFAQDAVVLAGLFALGVMMLTWPLAASLPVALLLVGVAAVPEGPAFAATFSVRQQRTPTALLAHVMSTISSLKVGCFSLGAALGGPLAEAVGPRMVLLIVAGVQLTGVVIGLAMRVAVVSPAAGAGRSAG